MTSLDEERENHPVVSQSRRAGLRVLTNTIRNVQAILAVLIVALVADVVALVFRLDWADAGFALFALAGIAVNLGILAVARLIKRIIGRADSDANADG